MTEVWKIMETEADGRHVSVRARGIYQRMYQEGMKAYPIEPSLLFAFATEEAARDWLRGTEVLNGSLWRCRTEIASKPEWWIWEIANSGYPSEIDEFWTDQSAWRRDNMGTWSVPSGTVLCKWIEPIEEIRL